MAQDIRKIAVIGSRTFPLPKMAYQVLELEGKAAAAKAGRALVKELIDQLSPVGNVVISGGAEGVDTWAAEFARERGMRVVEIRPNYKKYGRKAPLMRNVEIVKAAHDVVGFWDGESKGTMHAIRKAHELRRPYALFSPSGEIVTAVTEDMFTNPEQSAWKMPGSKAWHRGR